jgi:hypothetical protein
LLEIGEEIEAMAMLLFFGVPMNGGDDDEG